MFCTFIVSLLPVLLIAVVVGSIMRTIGAQSAASDNLRCFFEIFLVPLTMGVVFRYVLNHPIGGQQILVIDYVSRSRVRPSLMQAYTMMLSLFWRAALVMLLLILLVFIPVGAIGEPRHWDYNLFFTIALPIALLVSGSCALWYIARKGFSMIEDGHYVRFNIQAQPI